MISIVNISPGSPGSPNGEREYEVRINAKVICKFKHFREDGLSACLRRAANAVEESQWEKLLKSVEEIDLE